MEISRNLLAGALSALGKLVCRTSPVEAYRSVLIEGKENKISFRTAGSEESVTFTMDCENAGEFTIAVNFDAFRTAVKAGKNKTVVLDPDPESLVVDNTLLMAVHAEWPEFGGTAESAATAELPENFVGALATVAPIVNRSEPRRALQGIHLCREGVVATNGKELLHIGMLLEVDPLTIPFPHALLAAKCTEGGVLTTWAKGDQRFFTVTLGCWEWTAKALPGTFPRWKSILPDKANLPHIVSFDDERATQMAFFLKSIPADPPNNPVVLGMGDDQATLVIEARDMRTSVTAEFPEDWGDFAIKVNKDILLHLLNAGHHTLCFSDVHAPFLATGGIGTFVAMPIATKETQTVQPKQEEKTMNEMQTPVVAAHVAQPVALTNNINPEVPVNPLDELAAAIETFKLKLKASFDEASTLARKVKEAQIAQKQKEREFVQTQRTIEKIRMAI